MSLHIRPFTSADQSAVRQLILEGLGEHFGFIDESVNPDLDEIEREYVRKGHCFIVAEDARGLVGTGALMRVNGDIGQMVRVSVCAGCRRQGVGGEIVRYLLDTARQCNLKRVQVETNRDWHDAINLYRRFGFVQYDRDDVSVYMSLELH